MGNAETFEIEVAYAKPDHQAVLKVQVKAGATAREAVEHSGILEAFPEIDLATGKLGVFGKAVKPDQALRAGDRVEIYRPLLADPKEVRKLRAAQGKKMKRGGGDA